MDATFDPERYLPPAYEPPRPPRYRPVRVLVCHGRGWTRGLADAVARDPFVERVLQSGVSADAQPDGLAGTGLLFCHTLEWSVLLSPRYPADVPWTSLPHVGRPHWGLSDSERLLMERTMGRGDRPSEPLDDLLRDVTTLVLAYRADMQRRLSCVPAIESFLGRTLHVLAVEEDRLVPVPRERIAKAEAALRADTRLNWNWHWNAGMLLPGPVRHAFHGRLPPGPHPAFSASWEEAGVKALRRGPFALQMLYRVRADRPEPLPYHLSLEPGLYGIAGGAGLSRAPGASGVRVSWPGGWGTPSDEDSERGDLLLSLRFAQENLLRAGLVVVDRNRDARLGPAGAELLRLLPPGCRDLGMPARWVTSEGRIGRESDIPAMDRWCTTVLRHLKKASNALDAGSSDPDRDASTDPLTGRPDAR